MINFLELKKNFKRLLIALFLTSFFQVQAKDIVVFSNSSELISVDSSIFVYEDKTNNLRFE